MGLSSNPDNTLNYSERETQPTFNLREIVAAKVGSLLQDIIGLPSSLSRQYSGKSLWDVGLSGIDGQDRGRRPKTQLTRLVEEARQGDENVVEIPIKKSFHLDSEKSHSDNYTPAPVGQKQNEEEKYNIPNPQPHFSWEIIYSRPQCRSEADDKTNSLKIMDHFPGNDFFVSKTNSFINSSYMPFSLSSIACGFFDEADRSSSEGFHDIFGRNFGCTSIPRHMSIFKPQPLDSTFTGNAATFKNSLKGYDHDSSNYNINPAQGENQVSTAHNKQISSIPNPFDDLFFDGAQTDMDLYNFFTNWFSTFHKDTKNYGMSFTKQAIRDDCDMKTLSPFEKVNQEFDSLRTMVRSGTEAERVVSTFSSTVQHMGPDGRLYTSVKTSKTFGDGRNSTTTRDYMQNIDLQRHKEQGDE
ncbi:hypothetical protein GcM1_229087 [Golovinomyces cichoracearum]|uniref:Uncharacterized protein n=1 Tax=Golovinomyces cichoracearum TaxID=62708 RepID=A0A420INS5_9PEZI|nr:hypothetical protein GcM1_229087 [Golovinomyces cichoracearum]